MPPRRALVYLLLALALPPLSGAARAQASRPADTTRAAAADSGFVPAKSPLGAVVRSALVPGLGQFYTASYWKIPVVLGVTGFLAYGYFHENASYVRYRDAYASTVTSVNPSGDLILKSYREFYRDNRDTYAWWFLVAYLLQIADAYVDAQLYDFTVSDDAAGGVRAEVRVPLRMPWTRGDVKK